MSAISEYENTFVTLQSEIGKRKMNSKLVKPCKFANHPIILTFLHNSGYLERPHSYQTNRDIYMTSKLVNNHFITDGRILERSIIFT